jgi:hypothetical protein
VEDNALLRERPDPERATVRGTAAVRAVVRALDVPTARLAAAMLVALDGAGAAESPAQDRLEVRVWRSLQAIRSGEYPLRRRELVGGVEIQPERFGDRDRSVAAAFRDVGLAAGIKLRR